MTASVFNFLPQNAKNTNTPIFNAVMEAIKTGDDHVLEMLAVARNELFLGTATGSYLTNLANQFGFAVPQNSGLDQFGFRAVAMPAIWAQKQSVSTLNRIAEIFYSAAVLHPYIRTTQPEPYALQDLDSLVFETEDGLINILFEAAKFANISSLSASEVASTINSQSDSRLFGDVYFDRISQKNFVRVVSRNFGTAAKIRNRGGSAQNIIQFQDIIDTRGESGTVWNLTKTATYANTLRFTWLGAGTDPKTYNLTVGDTVSMRNLEDSITAPFSQLNRSYFIKDAGADYFEVENIDFQYSNVDFYQADSTQFCFTSKNYKNLFTNTEYATVSETTPNVIDISIPAIPPIVRRPLKGATRLRGSVIDVIDFMPNQIIVPYPNTFPDAGSFYYTSDRFNYGLDHRVYTYSSKGVPSGGTQTLNIESNGEQVPFLSAAEAAAALSVIADLNPIFGDIDNPDIAVRTTGVSHYFENAQEITIQDASIDIELFKHKTVTSILCPIGQDSSYFEHDVGSENLYIQFYTEDTKELAHLLYKPDVTDTQNRTRFYYLPELEGRFIRATICEMNPGLAPSDVTATTGSAATVSGGTTETFVHNRNTALTTFMVVDTADKHNVQGHRHTSNLNTVEYSYSEPSGTANIQAFCIDHQHFFPNLVRVVSTGVVLPAAPFAPYTKQVVHNLFSGSLIVEIRVTNPGTTGFAVNELLPLPKITIIDDTKFDITYDGTTDSLVVDIFILASYFNPLESVDGGLLRSQVNGAHVVRYRHDKSEYDFQILGTGLAPYGLGTVTTAGKNVTGVGTQFLTQTAVGDFILLPNGQNREVSAIYSNTSLKLLKGYNPSVGSATIYQVVSPAHNNFPYGVPASYGGAVIFGFDVLFLPDLARRTDIRFEFPDRVSRAAAGFIDGTRVALLDNFGTDIQPTVAEYLKHTNLTVHSQDGKYVYFRAGIGSTVGTIISGAKARRSGYFGGSNFKHFIQHAFSDWNNNTWFKHGKVVLLGSDVFSNAEYRGSYVYDTIGTISPFVVGSTSAVLQTPITALSAPGIIQVDTVANFPPTGFLFLDFGKTTFEGPVKYSLLIPGSPSQIRIDPAYIFKQSHADNAIVRLVTSQEKVDLKTDGSQYPTYLTGSTAARKTMEAILRDLVSLGVRLSLTVQIPELRFADKEFPVFE